MRRNSQLYSFHPFYQHWIFCIIVAYLITATLQLLVIFPIELRLSSENAVFASFLFLPHAVRVLSAWLLGPKSLLAIIPAGIIITLITSNHDYFMGEFLTQLLTYLFADCSAVLAFEFMRLCKIDANTFTRLANSFICQPDNRHGGKPI